MSKKCDHCKKEIEENQKFCPNCGSPQVEKSDSTYNFSGANTSPKSKIAAGLLGIFLGGFGVHNFYLGYTSKAIAQLLITLLTCGIGGFISSIWGFIEGILILTGSISYDANGNPLVD